VPELWLELCRFEERLERFFDLDLEPELLDLWFSLLSSYLLLSLFLIFIFFNSRVDDPALCSSNCIDASETFYSI